MNVYRRAGIEGFWQGTSAKMVESASKGAVLLFSKEAINGSLLGAGMDPVLAGLSAGAGGGICQVAVMGPCTFLVTAAVTSKDSNSSSSALIKKTWAEKGIKGFYP